MIAMCTHLTDTLPQLRLQSVVLECRETYSADDALGTQEREKLQQDMWILQMGRQIEMHKATLARHQVRL